MDDRAPTWNDVKRLVDDAMAMPPEARATFVEAACADEPELRTYIAPLIDLDATEPAGLGDTAPMSARWEGLQLGSYRILEEIGQGGMGAVFRADRIDGEFEQEVAIKVVTRGPLTAELRSRFLTERQLLAKLVHPNIARLLDGGTTADGIPYLVMELIDGEQITTYCRRRELSVAERLELMIQVCRAVDFAHRNLVVHRDLKPGNILVRSDGRVKLLDFGIAKLLDDAPEAGLTRLGERPGTLGYASPEQLLGERITTASDVYSLGVVLYQMLTSQRPFGETDDRWQAMAKVLQGERPPTPSQALRRPSGSTIPAGARRYLERLLGRSPARVRELGGDLDRIVMRSIARSPEERYGSADDLADDLERYLRHEPVSVAPARLGYRVGKFVRRHRGTVLAALLLVLSLVVGLVARSLEARRANRERAVAEQERAKAEDLAAFMLEDLWHSLAPEGQLKLLAPVAEKLRDYYAERAAEHDSPRVRRRHAEALAAVGNVLHEAGELEGAVRAYSDRLALLRSTAASPPDRDSLLAIAEALRDLASSQRDSLEQAGALLHLEQLRDLTGAWLLTHPDDQDAAFFAASAHDDRGIVLYDQQRLAAALDAFDRAAAHLARPPLAGLRDSATRDLRSQVDLHRGVVLQDLGRVEAARIALERSVEEADALWRDAPREIFRLRAMAFSRTVLAELLVEIERTDEASEIVSQVLPTLREAVLRDPGNAENRYVLANALETYARAHEGAGMADRAERARREIVEIAEPMAAGGDHVYLVDSYVRALLASGEVERAAPHARALLEQGWKHRGFRELCARYGLLVDGIGEPE